MDFADLTNSMTFRSSNFLNMSNCSPDSNNGFSKFSNVSLDTFFSLWNLSLEVILYLHDDHILC